MNKLWQLRKLSTNENLNEPQLLPRNWGPIFGLHNFVDRLGDLSWAGKPDMGWFEVGPAPEPETIVHAESMRRKVDEWLKDSAEMVAIDNTNVTREQRAAWMDYRQKLRDALLQPSFPENVQWPTRPE
jgi:hypothetical protein